MINILTQHLPPHGYNSLEHASKRLKDHVNSYLIIKKESQENNDRMSCCLPDVHFSELFHIWQSGFDTGQQDCKRFFQQTKYLHTHIAKADILYASSFKDNIKVAFALGYMRCINGYDLLPSQLVKKSYDKYCAFLSIDEATDEITNQFNLKFFKSLENGIKVYTPEPNKLVFMLKTEDFYPFLTSQKHKHVPFLYNRTSKHLNQSQQASIDKYLRSVMKHNKDDTLVFNSAYNIISEICHPDKDLKINCMNTFLNELF